MERKRRGKKQISKNKKQKKEKEPDETEPSDSDSNLENVEVQLDDVVQQWLKNTPPANFQSVQKGRNLHNVNHSRAKQKTRRVSVHSN
jgi:hypothetical protein